MRLAVWVLASVMLVGCSSASDLPLGGPYGGIASAASGGVVILGASGSGSGAGVDGGACAASGSGSGSAPTWTQLYTDYLAAGTIGNCGAASPCHAVDGNLGGNCGSAGDCWTWIGLQGQGGLADCQGGGLFSWDTNGYMPAKGPTSEPQAEADFTAWIAAGSLDN